jgi:hypothetical protein
VIPGIWGTPNVGVAAGGPTPGGTEVEVEIAAEVAVGAAGAVVLVGRTGVLEAVGTPVTVVGDDAIAAGDGVPVRVAVGLPAIGATGVALPFTGVPGVPLPAIGVPGVTLVRGTTVSVGSKIGARVGGSVGKNAGVDVGMNGREVSVATGDPVGVDSRPTKNGVGVGVAVDVAGWAATTGGLSAGVSERLVTPVQ